MQYETQNMLGGGLLFCGEVGVVEVYYQDITYDT